MTKQKYKEILETQYNDVIAKIKGWHELPNVLQALSDYINICIAMCERIYDDKEINYYDYIYLNEHINNNLKEVCRIVKKG
jgi:hypothetical protein